MDESMRQTVTERSSYPTELDAHLTLTVREEPICRTVEDTAKVLAAVVGYDARDPFTAFSIGREPAQPYASFATGARLDGIRIGVIREYMDVRLFSKRDKK